MTCGERAKGRTDVRRRTGHTGVDSDSDFLTTVSLSNQKITHLQEVLHHTMDADGLRRTNMRIKTIQEGL
jgi:hypothetical protein